MAGIGNEGLESRVASITVDRPQDGETLTVAVTPGLRVVLEFNPAAAKFAVEGDDFILNLEDGGQVVFAGLVSAAQGGDAPTLQIVGIDIDAGVLMEQALALTGQAEAEPIKTAAGEEGEGAEAEAGDGGGSRLDDSFGELIAGLIKQGIIGKFALIGKGDAESPVEVENLPDNLAELSLAELMTLWLRGGANNDLPENLTTLDIADLMTLAVNSGWSEEAEDETDKGSEGKGEILAAAAGEERVVGEDEQASTDESDADPATAPSSSGQVAYLNFQPIVDETLLGSESDDVLTGDGSGTGDGLVSDVAAVENFDSDQASSADSAEPVAATPEPVAVVNNVGAVSDADGAADSVAENAANGAAVGITALASDADGSDTVSYSLSDDAGGRFAIDASSGVITVADNTLLDYETAASHAVTVLATSTDGSTSSQGFTVNLTAAVNAAPTAADDSATTAVDAAVTLSVLANDSDPDSGDTLSITGITQGTNGTVVDNGNGTVTYTPDASYTGTDSFTYTISDGNGGSDTATVNVTIGGNVITGTSSNNTLTGTAGVDLIYGLGMNDTLSGLAGDDLLDGGDKNDTLEGGAGADTLDGGAGNDTATYSSSGAGVTVSLATGTGSGGDAEGDTLTGIENLIGSGFADILTGDGNANSLNGGAGDDTLDGGAGNDTLTGGAGADSLDGGAGTDEASYSGSGAGVTVNLATGTGSGGDAQGDTLANIENLTGSNFDDILTGDGNANSLTGGAGDDTLDGGAGDDTLTGGAGADDLDGGSGNDTAVYGGSGGAVVVSLATGTGTGNDAQGDILVNIENLTGSNSDDTLTGDANANILDGANGNDTLIGGAGDDSLWGKNDDDILDGGLGADTLDGGNGDDILVWDAADTTIDGKGGTDTLRVDGGDADLTAFAGTLQGIEVIDLQSDAGANAITLTAADVISMSDTDILTVDGDAGDSIDAGAGWTDGGIVGAYHVYTQGLATLNVDTDMTVNVDIAS